MDCWWLARLISSLCRGYPRPPSQQVSQILWHLEHCSFARMSISDPPHTGQAGWHCFSDCATFTTGLVWPALFWFSTFICFVFYLTVLTCPRTKEPYIGSATGADGFHGRWLQYFANHHGGNKGLKSREPSDYQVSILEIAGSAQTHDEILAMEGRW